MSYLVLARKYRPQTFEDLVGQDHVARTLANSPLALLLDEPTSALDDAAKLEVECAIQKVVRDQGLTCVIVTHDVAQAVRLAGRALVVEGGRIVRSGPVGEVLHA